LSLDPRVGGDFGLRRRFWAPVVPFSAVSASRGGLSPQVWAPVVPFPDDRTGLWSPEGPGARPEWAARFSPRGE